MILKCHAFDMTEKQNQKVNPERGLWLDCIGRWLCLYSKQELPVHLAQVIVFIVTNAAVWFAFPSQSNPIFCRPPAHAAPEYADLGAHCDPTYSQQTVSQATW